APPAKPPAARRSVALISVVTTTDSSQSVDQVKAQPISARPAKAVQEHSLRSGSPLSPGRAGNCEARHAALSKYLRRLARTRASGGVAGSGSANSRPLTFS